MEFDPEADAVASQFYALAAVRIAHAQNSPTVLYSETGVGTALIKGPL